MRLVPRSLFGQVMLAMGAALLVAQAISAALLWQAAESRRETALLHAAAWRLTAPAAQPQMREWRTRTGERRSARREFGLPMPRAFALRDGQARPLPDGARADHDLENQFSDILTGRGVPFSGVAVGFLPVAQDPIARVRASAPRWRQRFGDLSDQRVMVAAIRMDDRQDWRSVRVIEPPFQPRAYGSFLVQTVLIFLLLFAIMALMLRRITRPLDTLTRRTQSFAVTGNATKPLEPDGPEDLRRLIAAHNAMESRIGSMLDEKDVMLGAIGHDLKTPLAALRVRIESVSDKGARSKMAATIDDIARTLDDILSLARVGRSEGPAEPVDLAALMASVVEEYEDMDEPVTLAEAPRIVARVHETWLRRALRNLVGNALRYGGVARVSLFRRSDEIVLRVDDDGPGIPEDRIADMLEPFQRGESSRNRATGGAGLGLTLARAIAEQHGGTLVLSNRADAGLRAEIRLPA